MQTLVWSFLILSLAGVRVAAAEPAWCKGEGVDKTAMRYEQISSVFDADPSNALPAIVAMLCWPEDEARQRVKEIEKVRASWSKKLDLQESDWADVAQYASAAKAMRQGDLHNDMEKKYAWSTLSPIEQYAGIEGGFPNNGSGNGISEYTYLTDALGPRLTETGRLAYILQACLGYQRSVAEWAMCEPDLALLDRKKVSDEIRKDTKARAVDRMQIRLHVFALDDKLAAHAKEVNAAKAKEDAYKKMFEIAAATRKEWDGLWQSEPALIDLALTMDDARQVSSRKAYDGCAETTWNVWKGIVEKIPAKRFEGFSTTISDSWLDPALSVVTSTPQGFLASTALFTCRRADAAKDPVINTLGAVIGYLPGLRGPRVATLGAIRNAALELDDTSAKIDFPDLRYDRKYEGASQGGYYATVAKIKVDGAKATVSFTPKLEKQEQCASARRTNHITQIRPDGSLIYENVCLKYKTVTIDKAPDAQTVDVRYLAGVKPGMNVYIGGGAIGAAWVKGKKSPAMVAGVAVK